MVALGQRVAGSSGIPLQLRNVGSVANSSQNPGGNPGVVRVLACQVLANDPQRGKVAAARGCLGMLRGVELMAMLLNYADRSALFSLRLGDSEKPFVPESYRPFTDREPAS